MVTKVVLPNVEWTLYVTRTEGWVPSWRAPLIAMVGVGRGKGHVRRDADVPVVRERWELGAGWRVVVAEALSRRPFLTSTLQVVIVSVVLSMLVFVVVVSRVQQRRLLREVVRAAAQLACTTRTLEEEKNRMQVRGGPRRRERLEGYLGSGMSGWKGMGEVGIAVGLCKAAAGGALFRTGFAGKNVCGPGTSPEWHHVAPHPTN